MIGPQSDFALLASHPATSAGSLGGQGCMDFDTPTVAPSSDAACAGRDFPTAAPSPFIDAAGRFSVRWVIDSAASKLVAIPAL